MRVACIVACFALIFGAGHARAELRVKASVSAETVAVGQPFSLTVDVDHEVGTQVVWPVPLVLGPEVEERGRNTVSVGAVGALRSTAVFSLVAFDTAVTELPPIDLELRTSNGIAERLLVPAQALVVSGLVDRESPALRPLATPKRVSVRNWSVLAMLGGTGVLLLFILLGARLWGRAGRPTRPPRATHHRAPDEEALAALGAIEASGRLDGDALKPVFLDMSEILREFLGRQFGFSALDQTSSEIRSSLAEVPADSEWGTEVSDWLSECDLVKYAGAAASGDEARKALYAARLLVERTKEFVAGTGEATGA